MRGTASILAIMLAACNGGGGNDCPIGSLGCPCTEGGMCDYFLACATGVCVEAFGPDTDTAIDTAIDPTDTTGDTAADTVADTPDAELDIEDAECVPDCAGRDCGPDPVCGVSCGECLLPETCLAIGQCVPGRMTIVAGTFTMGSPITEPGRGFDENQHVVTLTHPFEIQTTEVTQGQFETLMGYNPSYFSTCGSNCPVEQVDWNEAAAYCNALSASGGLASCYTCTGSGLSLECSPNLAYTTPYDCPGFRLPTEAEWEYAARAGTTDGTYNGTVDEWHLSCEMPNTVLDPIAWFCGNLGTLGVTKHEVGGKLPNAWGLYDMLGSVWEWVHDGHEDYAGDVTDPWGAWTEAVAQVRGGSLTYGATDTRAAFRGIRVPTSHWHDIGFRPARTLP